MSDSKPLSFIKPTIHTKYCIDFDWWKTHDSNWRVFLYGCLCADHQKMFDGKPENETIDFVDPETGVVTKVDGLQSALMMHCAKEPGFVTTNTALVDAIFRVLVANGNNPLTPLELSDRIGKPAETILRTISGFQVYKGIRPCRS